MCQAGIAQLVERQPSKLNVASSTLVYRSISSGDIAQFGRATHLHCVGQRFDPAYLHQIMDIGNYIVNQIIQFNSNFLIELAVNQYLKTKG